MSTIRTRYVGGATLVAIAVAVVLSADALADEPPAAPEKDAASPAAKVREPKWLPVRELLATPISIAFAVNVTDDDGEADIEIRDQQVVCVRGIFPRQEQVDEIAKGLPELVQERSRTSRSSVDEFPHLVDFRIERQESDGEPKSWAGLPWREVSIEKSIDVLMNVSEFAPDVIYVGESCQVFTSPLPQLAIGEWDERVSHPRLKDNNVKRKAPDDGAKEAAQRPQRPDTVPYVLFRFLDFDVAEGKSYRYRVKLKFQNPAPEEGDRRSGVDEHRATHTIDGPWSEPSSVAVAE